MYTLLPVYTALALLSLAAQLHAGQLAAQLKPQIELQAACIVNNQMYLDGASAAHFGDLDFGEHSASFSGVIETALSGTQQNAIHIQCSDNAEVNVTLGAGQHDANVPTDAKSTYLHALSNGQDYVAYNLLNGDDHSIIGAQQRISHSGATALLIHLYAQASLSGHRISTGQYRDTITISIEF